MKINGYSSGPEDIYHKQLITLKGLKIAETLPLHRKFGNTLCLRGLNVGESLHFSHNKQRILVINDKTRTRVYEVIHKSAIFVC